MDGGSIKRLACVLALALIALMASDGVGSGRDSSSGSEAVAQASSGVFSVFSGCPLQAFAQAEVPPGRALCFYDAVVGGEITIGSIRTSIDRRIVIEGGAVPTGNPENEVEYFFVPAPGGDGISTTSLNVPGGLDGIIDCSEVAGAGALERLTASRCTQTLASKSTDLTATVELATSASHRAIFDERALNTEEGTAITLPIKVHLSNPLLGENCFIGSESRPIQLLLITGATSPGAPNRPIHGVRGKPRTLEEDGEYMLSVTGDAVVDNAFTVPGAEGCGGTLAPVLDPLIDRKVRLPSRDGENTAILDQALSVTAAESLEAVRRSGGEALARHN
jgi:hypothetical protein